MEHEQVSGVPIRSYRRRTRRIPIDAAMENLTVVIPCIEEIDLLKKCLVSIKDRLPGQKVIVMMMGSRSDDLIGYDGLEIQLIQSHRVSASAARNLGAKAADTEYVFFLDSDCVLQGSPMLWQASLAEALAEKPHLVVLQRGEADRQFKASLPSRWNFSRHCNEWNLIWSRNHFFGLGGLDESCCTGSNTLAQSGEAFSICFRHFEQPSAKTIYLPDLKVGHPSLSKPDTPPRRQFEYAYGSSYVAARQLRRKPSVMSLFWFVRTLAGFGADIIRGLRANSIEQSLRLLHARFLGVYDALSRSTPRPQETE